MTDLNLSAKGLALIDLYKKMAQEGYTRSDGEVVKVAFSDFESGLDQPPLRALCL
jgi:hypothetical protein